MTRTEFQALTADIEKFLEGEGYFLRVNTFSGMSVEGAWQWLNRLNVNETVIVVSCDDKKPLFIPLSSVESIRLSNQ